MYALRISIGDEPPIVAGAADLGSLSLIVSGYPNNGESNARRLARGLDPVPTFDCSALGLTARATVADDVRLHWIEGKPIHPGQTITIEIIETEHATPAITTTVAFSAEKERTLFEHCKQRYFALKQKYAPD